MYVKSVCVLLYTSRATACSHPDGDVCRHLCESPKSSQTFLTLPELQTSSNKAKPQKLEFQYSSFYTDCQVHAKKISGKTLRNHTYPGALSHCSNTVGCPIPAFKEGFQSIDRLITSNYISIVFL